MRLITLFKLLFFLLFINQLYGQVDNSISMSDPNPSINPSVFTASIDQSNLQDPFISIAHRMSNSPGFNYFAVLNGTPVIESKIRIKGRPEPILDGFVNDFRRYGYPFTITKFEGTFAFHGTIHNETKKTLLVYDPKEDVTSCVCSSETSNHELLQQRNRMMERFPELDQLPGDVAYFKEYHQGPITSACIKLEFRGGPEIAVEEVSARFTQYGWIKEPTSFKNNQGFIKKDATARVFAIESPNGSTAVIVISDQSILSSN